MDKKELIEKANETAVLLYQNREKEAMQGIRELLIVFQNKVQDMAQQQDKEVEISLSALKELLENYRSQDVIGMADWLIKKIEIFI